MNGMRVQPGGEWVYFKTDPSTELSTLPANREQVSYNPIQRSTIWRVPVATTMYYDLLMMTSRSESEAILGPIYHGPGPR